MCYCGCCGVVCAVVVVCCCLVFLFFCFSFLFCVSAVFLLFFSAVLFGLFLLVVCAVFSVFFRFCLCVQVYFISLVAVQSCLLRRWSGERGPTEHSRSGGSREMVVVWDGKEEEFFRFLFLFLYV